MIFQATSQLSSPKTSRSGARASNHRTCKHRSNRRTLRTCRGPTSAAHMLLGVENRVSCWKKLPNSRKTRYYFSLTVLGYFIYDM